MVTKEGMSAKIECSQTAFFDYILNVVTGYIDYIKNQNVVSQCRQRQTLKFK